MVRLLSLAIVLGPSMAIAQNADVLPAYVLQLPESVASILIAETDTSTLHRFMRGRHGLEPGDERYMSVGQGGVGKRRVGDRRTPLGIYFVNDQLDASGLHEMYGPTAFPLDYPNAWDRFNERTGDGIWIHGVTPGSGQRPPLDTDGCIALPNADLLLLEEHLVPLVTPVIIARKIRRKSAEQIAATRDELMAALDSWASSYRSGDWHRYLSLYATDFKYRGLDRDEWSAYRLQALAARPIQQFILDDVLLLGDPEEDGLFLSRFRQSIVDDEHTTVTIKRLYWRRAENGELKIVTEDNG